MPNSNLNTHKCQHACSTKPCIPVPPFSDTQWEPDAQWCPGQKFTTIKPQSYIFTEYGTTETPAPQWTPNMILYPGNCANRQCFSKRCEPSIRSTQQTRECKCKRKHKHERKCKHERKYKHERKHKCECKHKHKHEHERRCEQRHKSCANCPVPSSINNIVTAPLTDFVDDIRGYVYTRNPLAATMNAGGYHYQ